MRIFKSSSIAIVFIGLIVFGNSCKKDNTSSNTPAGCTGVSSLTATGIGSTARLKWNGGGSSAYSIQYRIAGSTSWLPASTTVDSASLSGLTPNSSYEWQVKNACMTGFSSSSTFSTVGCDPGYEGANCNTEVRQKFINSYSATESRNSNPTGTYPTTIIAGTGSDVTQVLITRVTAYSGGFFTNSVKATITGANLTIARQNPDGDSYYIAGNATLSGSTLNISYTLSGPNAATPPVIVTDSYSGTWVF